MVAGTLGIVLHCQVHLALSTKPPGCQAVKRRPSFQWWTPVLPHLARCAAQAQQVGPQALLAAICHLHGCLDWNWTLRVRRTAVTSRLQGLPHLGIFGLYIALGGMQTQSTGTGKSSPCRGDCWASNCAQILLHLPAARLRYSKLFGQAADRPAGRFSCVSLRLRRLVSNVGFGLQRHRIVANMKQELKQALSMASVNSDVLPCLTVTAEATAFAWRGAENP